MKTKILRWTGTGVFRGADDALSISLTCYPGDVVKVSEATAKELLKEDGWSTYEAPAAAAAVESAKDDGDPNAKKETAMHTGAEGSKSGDPANPGGKDPKK